jgi:tryptophan synthase beta chain
MKRFGQFGGRYVPETLIPALDQLSAEWQGAREDQQFWQQYQQLLQDFAGRPTPLALAASNRPGGASRLWLKREDLLHTGAHKINNALGQVLLAQRLGKSNIIAETGAGQHGVATAAACAHLGLQCRVWMGAEDIERQAPNVARMKLFGATVLAAPGTLSSAVSAAIRDWTATPDDSHYIIGSAVGPAPYPEIVAQLQRVIGAEARQQFKDLNGGRLPQTVLACLGGGSNAIGGFYDFLDDPVRLVVVEAGGSGEQHGASLQYGSPGVLHGSLSLILQTAEGQVKEAHSLSAGLDYPGVGPQLAALFTSGRLEAHLAEDQSALEALRRCSEQEGILPALETAHALAWFYQQRPEGDTILILSGRGDKDLGIVAEH